ncbi:MAG: hypothetical protein D6757_10025 [Alphaproteobacteria bacterium]|nr:MAG: hypothetical protein D6757_10025 [Alphaproteobacteria bacterium]
MLRLRSTLLRALLAFMLATLPLPIGGSPAAAQGCDRVDASSSQVRFMDEADAPTIRRGGLQIASEDAQPFPPCCMGGMIHAACCPALVGDGPITLRSIRTASAEPHSRTRHPSPHSARPPIDPPRLSLI